MIDAVQRVDAVLRGGNAAKRDTENGTPTPPDLAMQFMEEWAAVAHLQGLPELQESATRAVCYWSGYIAALKDAESAKKN